MQKTIHDERYRALIQWLKTGRERQGLSMRAVARKLGVPHSWVGKIEQMERRLDLLEYARLCSVLNVCAQHGLTLLRDNPAHAKTRPLPALRARHA